MNLPHKRLGWIAIGGIAVYAALVWSVGRTPAEVSSVDLAQMRQVGLQATRELVGLDMSDWEWQPKDVYSQPLRTWQLRYGKGPFDYLMSPLQVRLGFESPSEDMNIRVGDPSVNRDISVMVGGNGRLVSIRQDRSSNRDKKKKPRQKLAVSDRQKTAEKALALLAGEFRDQFKPAKWTVDDETADYRWTAAAPGSKLTWEVTVSFEGNNFTEAVLGNHIEEDLLKELQKESQAFGEASRVAFGVSALFGSFFLFISYILRWLRGHIDHRSALTAGIVMAVCAMLSLGINALLTGKDNGVKQFAPMGTIVGVSIWLTIAAVAVIGVGHDCARRHEWPLWRELRLLLQRNWLARDIGRTALVGFAWSGVIALVPLLILQLGVFGSASLQWSTYFHHRLANPIPATEILLPILDMGAMCLFAGMVPVITNAFSSRRVGLAIFVVLGSAISVLLSPFGSGLAAAVVDGLVTTLLLLWIYNSYGLMAVLFASKGEATLHVISMLMTAADGGARAAGWMMLLTFLGLVALTAVLATRGSEVEPDSSDMSRRYLSQKERLKAEFSLAQEAQQRMLPAHAPAVAGFSLAGSCQPARDVGGDLYDYFHFPDGKLGICVADVSGKGMPAALYMTLTKGVIAAAAPDSSDVTTLAKHLNRHLHIACKRKMFVTAILGALDAKTRAWEFIRAGHNPLLHYEAATRSARYLSPAGLGLGMTGPAMFDRGIRIERVQLAPGDILVLYSDGLTEAMNEEQELYGEDRLKQTVERSVNGQASALLEEIKRDVAVFTGTEPAHDDMTIVVLQADSEAS